MPDSGISTFWIFFFSTCVILNYTGKQLVSRELESVYKYQGHRRVEYFNLKEHTRFKNHILFIFTIFNDI